MITGAVNTNREATVRLLVRGPDRQEETIEAVVDTGFTGYLTLPSSLISFLGLMWLGRQQGILGDGSIQQFDVYTATVMWDNRLRTIEIDAAETIPLIGMSLLYGHELRIQAVENGQVTIEALHGF